MSSGLVWSGSVNMTSVIDGCRMIVFDTRKFANYQPPSTIFAGITFTRNGLIRIQFPVSRWITGICISTPLTAANVFGKDTNNSPFRNITVIMWCDWRWRRRRHPFPTGPPIEIVKGRCDGEEVRAKYAKRIAVSLIFKFHLPVILFLFSSCPLITHFIRQILLICINSGNFSGPWMGVCLQEGTGECLVKRRSTSCPSADALEINALWHDNDGRTMSEWKRFSSGTNRTHPSIPFRPLSSPQFVFPDCVIKLATGNLTLERGVLLRSLTITGQRDFLKYLMMMMDKRGSHDRHRLLILSILLIEATVLQELQQWKARENIYSQSNCAPFVTRLML